MSVRTLLTSSRNPSCTSGTFLDIKSSRPYLLPFYKTLYNMRKGNNIPNMDTLSERSCGALRLRPSSTPGAQQGIDFHSSNIAKCIASIFKISTPSSFLPINIHRKHWTRRYTAIVILPQLQTIAYMILSVTDADFAVNFDDINTCNCFIFQCNFYVDRCDISANDLSTDKHGISFINRIPLN